MDRWLMDMERERWDQLIDSARAKAELLPEESATRRAARPEWFEALRTAEPPHGNDAPPLLLHLHRSELEQLRAFDADVDMVCAAAMPEGGSRTEILPFGQVASNHGARQWFAGVLEMAIQARLLHEMGPGHVELSPPLPNGRYADAVVAIGDRRVWIEVSALSDDDATIGDFDTAKSVQPLHGDPYLDARRVYRKVFDKVVGTLADPRSQIHPGEPSVVVVGDAAWRSAGTDGLGFGWALDQLTDPTTRQDPSRASLTAWLAHDYPAHEEMALAGLSALSALAVVGSDLTLLEFRVNRSADDAHRLQSEEIQDLCRLLDPRPLWRAV